MSRPQTVVLPDPPAVARAVAQRIAELSQGGRAAASAAPDADGGRRIAIALAGGATPQLLYETLAAEPFRSRVDWPRLELFFGDERAVPPEHPDSNFGMVSRALLTHVQVTAHRMVAERGEAEAYARLLGERVVARAGDVPALDLVLLGVGEDGHTASLFPGSAALGERRRWVVMNEVPKLGARRMTLTYPVLDAARRVWILVTGARKRQVVARCLAAADEPGAAERWPVVGIRPAAGELVWWLDAAAAGEHEAEDA